MKLLADWKKLVRYAWSIRLVILAGLLSAAEIILPLFFHTMPRYIFGVLSFFFTCAAVVARLVAQREFVADETSGNTE